MTIRKIRNFSSGFNMPAPYHPGGGTHATTQVPGEFPYCTLMQVAEEDKYADYVICRGYDPRMRVFIDYEEGNADKPGIMVAKPFGKRVECYYQIGQVYPAMLPIQGTPVYTPASPSTVPWRVGQNPGVAETACVGQPQSLSQTIDELVDHNGVNVNWLLIDGGPAFLWATLSEDLFTCGEAGAEILVADGSGRWCNTCPHTTITVTDGFGAVASSALAEGSTDLYIPSGSNVLVMSAMSSEGGKACHWVPVAFGSDECCLEPSPSSPSPSLSSPSSPSSSSPSSPSSSSPSSSSPSPSSSSPSPSSSSPSPSSPSPSSPSSPSPSSSSPSSPSSSSPSPSSSESVSESQVEECGGCIANGPLTILCQIAGMQNGTGCALCDQLNGDYEVPFDSSWVWLGGDVCFYEYDDVDSITGDGTIIRIWITKWNDNEYSVEVEMINVISACAPDDDSNLYWYHNQAVPYNCLNLNLSVPLDRDEVAEKCHGASCTLIS